jgi:LysM repeat protein
MRHPAVTVNGRSPGRLRGIPFSRASLIVLVVLVVGVAASSASTASAQDQNLLVNPSFEQPFEPDLRGDGGGFVAHGWHAWWFNDAGDEYDAPEFKPAHILVDPYRVRSGEDAQQYFRAWAKHLAGVYQTVQVPANSQLRFTVYGHAWSSFCDTSKKKDIKCDARDSAYGDGINAMAMKVGIDPTGGTDPFSPAIVWSAAMGVYDNYGLFSVDATAQGSTVTVFTYSTPDWPSAVINVYWDDAGLVVTGEGSAEPAGDEGGGDEGGGDTAPPPTSSGGGGGGKVSVQEARADGSVWHVVQPGETLLAIASAYGVTTDTILELNNLTNASFIYSGQELLIKPASGGAGEEEEEEEEKPEEEPAKTEEPPAVAEEPPVVETNQICLTLFEDANEDGLRQGDEMLLAGGTLNLAGVRSDDYTTDGASEPHCFTDLEAGDYIVSAVPPIGYHTTGVEQIPVTLSTGGNVSLNFGAAIGSDEAATEAEAVEASDAGNKGGLLGGKTGLIVAIGAVGAVLMIGGGVASYLVISRQMGDGESAETGEAEEPADEADENGEA